MGKKLSSTEFGRKKFYDVWEEARVVSVQFWVGVGAGVGVGEAFIPLPLPPVKPGGPNSTW